jgi:hypothetical protein
MDPHPNRSTINLISRIKFVGNGALPPTWTMGALYGLAEEIMFIYLLICFENIKKW